MSPIPQQLALPLVWDVPPPPLRRGDWRIRFGNWREEKERVWRGEEVIRSPLLCGGDDAE